MMSLDPLSVHPFRGCGWGADRSERDRMTRSKHLKRMVRSRAARTGESYTTALRAVRRHRQEPTMPTDAVPAEEEVIASCSFCGKPNTAVERLVAGPSAFICNECVGLSAEIVAASAAATPGESRRSPARFADRPTDDILALLPGLDREAVRAEEDLARWVGRLRERGTDWTVIAGALGTTVEAARRRLERG